MTYLLSVYPHTGMAHGTVKEQGGTVLMRKLGCFKLQTIPSRSHKRKPTGSSRMCASFLLSILCNGHMLTVVV